MSIVKERVEKIDLAKALTNKKSGITKFGDCYVSYGEKIINSKMKEIKIVNGRYREPFREAI